MPSQTQLTPFPVVEGGRIPLSKRQRQALSFFADVMRGLPDQQVNAVIELLHELRTDGYLERLRSHEVPAVKILAEVINGWDLDGVYEFAQAWVSTLISRQDGFDWASCTPEEKAEHRRRVRAEMKRRGVPTPL